MAASLGKPGPFPGAPPTRRVALSAVCETRAMPRPSIGPRRGPARGPRRAIAPAAPPTAWLSLAVGAAFLACFLALVPSVAGDGDSSEFTVVLALPGLAHPTGYAVYTLLGHAFVSLLHTLGAGWAWAANAWSAIGAALAIGAAHALAARLLARAGVPARAAGALACLPAAALGFDPAWLHEATMAEVNAWHVAWVMGAMLLAWTTAEALEAGGAPHVARRAAVWSLYVGLGASHHATSVLVSLPLTLALLASARPLRPATLAAAGCGLAVPPLTWTYVLYRSYHPAVAQWEALGPGLNETWNHVTAAGYRHFLGSFAPLPAQRSELLRWVAPGIVPGVVAAPLWARAPGRLGTMRWASAGAVLLPCVFGLAYGVEDPVSYFLAPLAISLCLLPPALAAWPAARARGRWLGALGAAAMLALAWAGITGAIETRTSLGKMDDFLRRMWTAIPLEHGYVLFDRDASWRLVEYAKLDRIHANLVVVRPRLLMDDEARRIFAARHGIDPLGGASPPPFGQTDRPDEIAAFAHSVAEGINRSSRDSVVQFMPEVPSLRLLTKPASASARR